MASFFQEFYSVFSGGHWGGGGGGVETRMGIAILSIISKCL